MRNIFAILILTVAFAFPTFAQNQNTAPAVAPKIEDMTYDQFRAYQQMVKAQSGNQAIETISNLTPEKIDKYAQIGKAFGTAFKECWTTVSTDAEKFAQSDAGKLTMFLIAWKIVGQDGVNLVEKAIQYFVGIPLLFTGTLIFTWIIRRKCFERPQLVSATKVGWFTVKKEYKGTVSASWDGESALWATVFYGLFIGICCLIIFVG